MALSSTISSAFVALAADCSAVELGAFGIVMGLYSFYMIRSSLSDREFKRRKGITKDWTT